MSFQIEGPFKGAGKLEGMKVYTATPVLPASGAAVLLEATDEYFETLDKMDELKAFRGHNFLKLLLTMRLNGINDQIKAAQVEIDDARTKLPF